MSVVRKERRRTFIHSLLEKLEIYLYGRSVMYGYNSFLSKQEKEARDPFKCFYKKGIFETLN
jgi:hypothetical protein